MDSICYSPKGNQITISDISKPLFLNSNIPFRASCRTSNPSTFNFYRQDSNFGYVSGNLKFEGECRNSLIISDKFQTTLSNVQDCFVAVYGDSVSVLSIDNLEEISFLAERILNNKELIYHIPKKVKSRESLEIKDFDLLIKEVKLSYGIVPLEFKEIDGTSKRGGLFYIRDNFNRKYVLKYGGKDREKLRAIAKLTNSIPDIFPRILPNLIGDTVLELSDGFYAIEEFVTSVREKPSRDRIYFQEVGKLMAQMHNRLEDFHKENPDLINFFISRATHLSNSNIASLWIDLSLAGFKKERREVEILAKYKLEDKVCCLPYCFIHGDLNYSNVLWTLDGPKFIDVESIKMSKKVLDLESTLIFQGNMEPPVYVSGSIYDLIRGYNSLTSKPFVDQEVELGSLLTKYALLKNFTIRNIRRGEKNNSLRNLLDNLKRLEEDRKSNGF
jgi:hypothetical protein